MACSHHVDRCCVPMRSKVWSKEVELMVVLDVLLNVSHLACLGDVANLRTAFAASHSGDLVRSSNRLHRSDISGGHVCEAGAHARSRPLRSLDPGVRSTHGNDL